MKKHLRPLAVRIPALLIMLLLCAVAVLYLRGWFDISLIVRGSDDENTNETETETTAGAVIDPPGETKAPSLSTEAPAGTEERPDASDTEPVQDMFAVEAIPDGNEASYAEWTPEGGWRLYELIGAETLLPNYFSSGKKIEFDISYSNRGDGSPNDVNYTPREVDRPAVYTYMGSLIVETEQDGVYNIISADGETVGSFDENVIVPAYCRDKDGKPLYEAVGEHGAGTGVYYYINEQTHTFDGADYIPAIDSRGVRFDYAPDYGAPSDSRTFTARLRKRSDGDIYEFALADEKGKRLRDYNYTAAYEFSEERAAVVNEKGQLYYISRSGSTAIKAARTRKIPSQDRTVVDILLEPLTDGKESIGFYYYDHGLVRARVLAANYYRYNSKNETYAQSDENIVMTMEGERFYIPAGYEVKAYSCGMLLLNGAHGYGYMDYTGRWVIDPDLDEASAYSEGLAVIKKDGKCALVDTNGGFVIPYGVYDHIEEPSTGIIAAYGGGKWTVIAKVDTAAGEDQTE